LEATVAGRVQGVGFRWFVLDVAGGLGLTGWVSNEADGTVRCVAEGDQAALRALLAALGEGPPGARVVRVVPTWGRASGTLGPFQIRSGGHRGD
jgi:acylphosphatase